MVTDQSLIGLLYWRWSGFGFHVILHLAWLEFGDNCVLKKTVYHLYYWTNGKSTLINRQFHVSWVLNRNIDAGILHVFSHARDGARVHPVISCKLSSCSFIHQKESAVLKIHIEFVSWEWTAGLGPLSGELQFIRLIITFKKIF